MPYWRREYFIKLAAELHVFDGADKDSEAQFFVSGGNLKVFLGDDGRKQVAAGLQRIKSPAEANFLLDSVGCSNSREVNYICMRGVIDISDPTHYVSLKNWKRCFTSKLALLGLMSLTSPTNFHWSLKVVGDETKNADLERLAAKFCVHALVREGKTIHLRRRKYTLIDSESHSSDSEELIKWEKANIIKCEGETTKRCVTAMTRWAKDPTTMDYWIPAASLRDSVAAVAKWTTPNGKLQFGLLQLTVSTSCIIDWEVVRRLAHPLITKRSSVCYPKPYTRDAHLLLFEPCAHYASSGG